MLESFGKALATVPFSTTRPGVTGLVIRAVDAAQAPLEEHDLRSAPASAEGAVMLAKFHESADCCYEARAYWDIWAPGEGGWKRGPQPLEIICNGEEYDGGTFESAGHIQIDLGFDELFANDEEGGSTEIERRRENARVLYLWLRQLKSVLPVERQMLWSETGENFEARLDAMLAQA